MNKVEHIGIAVKSLQEGIILYEELLQTKCYKIEVVESEHVETAFFKFGETKIELLSALNNEGVIAKFIERKGEGLHHIAYAVDDIIFEMNRLKDQGFDLLSDLPKEGADGKLVCFVHPKNCNGVLTELCMDKPCV